MPIVPTSLNGSYPATLLRPLPGFDGDGGVHQADMLAVASYERLRRDMLAAGQGDLVPSSGWSCYRTRADQQRMRDQGLTTVAVGKSIHGEAMGKAAVDFKGISAGDTPSRRRHAWLTANAGRYGWYQPRWAVTGISGIQAPEPWHWEYDSAMDTRPRPPAPPVVTEPEPQPEPEPDTEANLMRLIQRGGSAGTVVLLEGGGTYIVLSPRSSGPAYIEMMGAPQSLDPEVFDKVLAILVERTV